LHPEEFSNRLINLVWFQSSFAVRLDIVSATSGREKSALVAVALKSLDSCKDAIVHRVHDVLLATKVFFRGLDGSVAQQKLYLLELASGLAAQFRACPSFMPHAA
jgi:hypothetical protein